MRIDTALRDIMRSNVERKGDVYILKYLEYFKVNRRGEPALLKIGMTRNIKERMNDLRNKCGVFDISVVENGEMRSIAWYSRIESLVHCEL